MKIWKGVVGYENHYHVSEDGEIRSVQRSGTPGKVLKQHDNKGYKRVFLSYGNKKKPFSVHRLVAIAFLESIDGSHIVNHRDGNKTNNHFDNLEWCTKEYNEQHKKGVLGQDGKGSKNSNYGIRKNLMYPSEALRNRICELGVPRYKHNLAELGEMLPFEAMLCYSNKLNRIWNCLYAMEQREGVLEVIHSEQAKTEADARAKMLIYLIEQGLVKV